MMALRRSRDRHVVGLFVVFLFLTYYMSFSPESSYKESIRLARFMNSGASSSHQVVAKESSFDWSQVPQTEVPEADMIALPEGKSKQLPRVQYQFAPELPNQAAARNFRRDQVRNVFQNDWDSYREFAWKKDALNPLSGTAKDQFSGWAATLVDSLDSLWILGLRDQFDEAVAAVAEIDFGVSTSFSVNIFETNIRYLGGLLAAYDLSKRRVLLTKAVEVGNFVYAGFNTKNRMPVDFVDFSAAKKGGPLTIENWAASASSGTLSLEMTRLSQVTGDPKYYAVVTRVMREFEKQQQKTRLPGLWPTWISMRGIDLSSREGFTLGSGSDSLYEYLPKMYALLGGLEPMYETMTKNFMAAANKYMFYRPMLPGEEDVLMAGNIEVHSNGNAPEDRPMNPESEHLDCFIGGTMALAGRLLNQPSDVEIGAKLAKGCAYAYQAFPSGVMPEKYNMVPCEPQLAQSCPWDEARWVQEREKRPEWKEHLPKGFTTAKDPRYLLRPEAIESIFLLYRITGDSEYQEIAWKMFQSVDKASKTKHGHASIHDVTIVVDGESQDSNLEDYMESFWFAETLKYYYLIFSPPDFIDLDEFVLNTEAHPFRRPT